MAIPDPDLLQASPADYRLLRLVLIDSYSPGRVVEFPVDGGAVLTGRNGRGKTTLLQLVPIFYGENPTRIVGTETNRLDFNGYYLPRLTSYIVFEYLRRDVPCLVVLHASAAGGERRYRLVRSAYRADLFLLPDGTNILQATDLRRHFKLKGVLHSEALSSVSEYRGVIQGKVGSGKAAQRLRALAADYAYVGPGHHLTHMEKIVSGMFLRRTDFQDLQRMVVSCISEGDAEIALSTERRKIASWPEHYGAYTRAMDEAARMAEVLEQEARLVAIEAELCRIHARVLRLLAHLEATDADNRRERARQAGQASEEEQTQRQIAEGIRIRLETAGREVKDQEGRVAALDCQEADWINRDIPAKAERLQHEPALRTQLGQLEQRRAALLGEQEQISLKYGGLVNDLDAGHTRAEADAGRARTDLFQGFEPRLKGIDTQAREDLDRLRADYAQARDVLDGRLRETAEAKGEWRQRASAPQADAELVATRDATQAVVEERRAGRDQAEAAVRQAAEALAKAKAAWAEQEERRQRLERKRDDLERLRQARLLQQSPGEDSLLHFLRTQRPDWVFDVAKVVREDLLVCTDLAPELIETLPAFYGVGLDLGHLDAHLAADEAALRRAIADLADQRARLDAELKQAEQGLADGERSRRQADQGLNLANAGLQQALARVQSAQAEAKEAQRRLDQGLKEAAQGAKARLAELADAESVLKAGLTALAQQHQAAVKAREAVQAQARQAIEAERDQALAAHDRERDQARARHAAQRTEILSERDQALGAAGVDTAALKRLEQDIATAETQLQAIARSRDEVGQWHLWLRNEWPRRDEHIQAAAAARDLEAAARADQAAEEKRWKARQAELEAALKDLDRRHARLEQELVAVRGRLDGFRAYAPDPQVMGQPFDSGWALEALTQQANANQAEAAALAQAIGRLIERIKRAFSEQRDTPPDQFYESHRAALGPDASPRAWVPVFQAWFDREHDAYRRLLATEANQIAGAIVGFHRDMDAFHRQVLQFNRELQQSLDENLGFESVSRVTVEVKSVIRELEYWQPIEAMAEEHRAWLQLDGQGLPPPEFAATLRALLGHWEVREGIRAALPSLIRIQGEVVENGQTRVFRKAADLERVSSNGLSYLILCVIFIAFINRIRRQARVEIVWALDELKDLDIGNIEALLAILRRNAITLVSAFPDPDAEVLALFRHQFSVEEGRRLLEVRVLGPDGPEPESGREPESEQEPESADV